MTAGELPPCPVCGVAPAWSIPKLGLLEFGCICFQHVFATEGATMDDVAALRTVVEEFWRELLLQRWIPVATQNMSHEVH